MKSQTAGLLPSSKHLWKLRVGLRVIWAND